MLQFGLMVSGSLIGTIVTATLFNPWWSIIPLYFFIASSRNIYYASEFTNKHVLKMELIDLYHVNITTVGDPEKPITC